MGLFVWPRSSAWPCSSTQRASVAFDRPYVARAACSASRSVPSCMSTTIRKHPRRSSLAPGAAGPPAGTQGCNGAKGRCRRRPWPRRRPRSRRRCRRAQSSAGGHPAPAPRSHAGSQEVARRSQEGPLARVRALCCRTPQLPGRTRLKWPVAFLHFVWSLFLSSARGA